MSGDRVGPMGRVVAGNVRRLRQLRGLSLRGLADLVQATGGTLSADAINKIENGRDKTTDRQVRHVDVDDLVMLANALDVALDRLLDDQPCEHCHGAPPAGFTCNTCSSPEPPTVIRRFRLTREHLADVADVYRGALARGLGPTRTVADVFGVPHSTAAKWVTKARRASLLGETSPGKAGDLR